MPDSSNYYVQWASNALGATWVRASAGLTLLSFVLLFVQDKYPNSLPEYVHLGLIILLWFFGGVFVLSILSVPYSLHKKQEKTLAARDAEIVKRNTEITALKEQPARLTVEIEKIFGLQIRRVN
jgi:hypothetical protein